MNYCKDCVHCVPFQSGAGMPKHLKFELAKCSAFPSKVDGKADAFCNIMRGERGHCGPEGEKFERKPEVRPWWRFWR